MATPKKALVAPSKQQSSRPKSPSGDVDADLKAAAPGIILGNSQMQTQPWPSGAMANSSAAVPGFQFNSLPSPKGPDAVQLSSQVEAEPAGLEPRISVRDKGAPGRMTAAQLKDEGEALVSWLNQHRTPSPERQETVAAFALVCATAHQKALAKQMGPGTDAAGMSLIYGFLAGLDRAVDEKTVLHRTKEQLSTTKGKLNFQLGLHVGGTSGALRSLKENVEGLVILAAGLPAALVLALVMADLGPARILALLRAFAPAHYETLMISAAKIDREIDKLLVGVLTDREFLSNSGFSLGLGIGVETGESMNKEYLAGDAYDKGKYVGDVLGYVTMEMVLFVVPLEEIALKGVVGASKGAVSMAKKLSSRAQAIARTAPDFFEMVTGKAANLRKMLEEFAEALRLAKAAKGKPNEIQTPLKEVIKPSAKSVVDGGSATSTAIKLPSETAPVDAIEAPVVNAAKNAETGDVAKAPELQSEPSHVGADKEPKSTKNTKSAKNAENGAAAKLDAPAKASNAGQPQSETPTVDAAPARNVPNHPEKSGGDATVAAPKAPLLSERKFARGELEKLTPEMRKAFIDAYVKEHPESKIKPSNEHDGWRQHELDILDFLRKKFPNSSVVEGESYSWPTMVEKIRATLVDLKIDVPIDEGVLNMSRLELYSEALPSFAKKIGERERFAIATAPENVGKAARSVREKIGGGGDKRRAKRPGHVVIHTDEAAGEVILDLYDPTLSPHAYHNEKTVGDALAAHKLLGGKVRVRAFDIRHGVVTPVFDSADPSVFAKVFNERSMTGRSVKPIYIR